MTSPSVFPRRSPVYRKLGESGLDFVAYADSGLAVSHARRPTTLSVIDLSVLPRWGLKGREVFTWLSARGATVPQAEQSMARQPDGTQIARLSPTEALVLPSPVTGRAEIGTAIESIPESGAGYCFPVPRRDSHGWFMIAGVDAPRMFAKLCGVDLAADRFADGRVAQTSVARLSAIIIRNDLAGRLAYSLLSDSASAEYLWDCLLDAMYEFGGGPAGIDHLGFSTAMSPR